MIQINCRTHILWLSILFSIVAGLVLPFVYVRPGEAWRPPQNRGLPISLEEKFLQLNTDQTSWVRIIADFPFHYRDEKVRINRPLYPAMINFPCRTAEAILQLSPAAFVQPCRERIAFGMALVVNWLLLIALVFGFYKLLRDHWQTGEDVAFVAAVQLALAPVVLWNISEASPDLTAVAIVVSALWLFTILDQRGTTRVSIGIGLLLGLLMLIKGQYGVLMTGWVVLFLRRRYRATVISFIAHILPLLGWIGLLNLWGLEYYNHEIEYFHQIVWIWEEFIHWPLSQQLHYWIAYTVDYMREFGKAFGPIIIFAAAWGLWQRENRKWWLLTVVALFMT